MFKELSGFLTIIILIIVLKWALPPEASELASEILVKVLTLIKDLLMQVQI